MISASEFKNQNFIQLFSQSALANNPINLFLLPTQQSFASLCSPATFQALCSATLFVPSKFYSQFEIAGILFFVRADCFTNEQFTAANVALQVGP